MTTIRDFTNGMLFLALLMAGIVTPTLAKADLKVCNTTTSRIGIAIGYKDEKGWATEGWWNIPSQSCEVLLKGKLIARYYYVHAVDYDRGGAWAGKSTMCTIDKSFTIRDISNCQQRGYNQTGFFEVDTGNANTWTVRLSDPTAGGTTQ